MGVNPVRRSACRSYLLRGEGMRGKIFLLLGLVALSGCAPTTKWSQGDNFMIAAEREKQMDMAVEMLEKDKFRLADVSSVVLSGATDLCGEKTKPTIGISWVSAEDIKGPMKEAIVRRHNLTGNNLVILYAGKDGPAYKAGVRGGDRLLGISGIRFTSSRHAQEFIPAALKDKSRWPITISVQRGEQVLDLQVTPQTACDYPVDLVDQDAINAYADGKKIYVTRGMMRFINEDRELALVVAHELAHNTMGHIGKKSGNALLGALVDGVAAAYGVNTQGAFSKAAGSAYSQDFEMEADYVGLYAMARSGQDITDAANFWRRMGAANPGSIQQKGYFSSHPSSPERFVAIDKAVAEIKAKKAAGKPIIPEMKTEPVSTVAEKPVE